MFLLLAVFLLSLLFSCTSIDLYSFLLLNLALISFSTFLICSRKRQNTPITDVSINQKCGETVAGQWSNHFLCRSLSLQYHHSMGKGPWKRCLRAHHQAVPQRARIHSQRQLRHLQRLWEDLGRGPTGADREAQCGCPAGCPTRLGKPSGYGFEGVCVWSPEELFPFQTGC